jgi:hypothetical protein
MNDIKEIGTILWIDLSTVNEISVGHDFEEGDFWVVVDGTFIDVDDSVAAEIFAGMELLEAYRAEEGDVVELSYSL